MLKQRIVTAIEEGLIRPVRPIDGYFDHIKEREIEDLRKECDVFHYQVRKSFPIYALIAEDGCFVEFPTAKFGTSTGLASSYISGKDESHWEFYIKLICCSFRERGIKETIVTFQGTRNRTEIHVNGDTINRKMIEQNRDEFAKICDKYGFYHPPPVIPRGRVSGLDAFKRMGDNKKLGEIISAVKIHKPMDDY